MVPGLRRSPKEGKGYPLQFSGLENSMDCIVHGVTKSWTRLSDFHLTSLVSSVQQSDCCTYILFFRLFSSIGYYKIWSIVSCTIIYMLSFVLCAIIYSIYMI